MAEFTSTELDNISRLATHMQDHADEIGRELLVGVADEDGGLPEAWILAKPTEVPAVMFEPPSWLDLLFEDDNAEDPEVDEPDPCTAGHVEIEPA